MLTSRKSLWWWLTLVGCVVSLLAASRTAPAQERQPAAELIALIGKAEIKSPGETQFRSAKLQDKLYPQDQIRTLVDSRAKLFFQDESILILGDNTTLDIAKFQLNPQGQRQSAFMKLLDGSLRFIVQKVTGGVPPNFEIQGKTAVMGIRGTDGVFETRSPDRISLLGGDLSLFIRNLNTGETLILHRDHYVIATPRQPMRTGVVTPLMRQQYQQYYRLAQSFVPGTVSCPGSVYRPGQGPVCVVTPSFQAKSQELGITFGNPLLPQTNQFLNTFNPSAQGTGTLQAPLAVTHSKLLP